VVYSGERQRIRGRGRQTEIERERSDLERGRELNMGEIEREWVLECEACKGNV
jgi:hypothetical protein